MGNKPTPKVRLDTLLVERRIAVSCERARALIMSGAVVVGESRIDKAGTLVPHDAEIRIKGEDNPYVGRGGLKLRGALREFGIAVKGLVALDVGASTGGFTDCLLQEGAARVYALDVGYGQLAWKLREDPRVINLERTNIRTFDGAGVEDKIDIVTIDASFISLTLVLPAVIRLLEKGALLLALIKPQFEVGRKNVEKHGVVRDPLLHQKVVEEIAAWCREQGLAVLGTCESPLKGPAGNREFFLFAKKSEGSVA